MKKQMNRRAAVLSLAMAAMLALPTMASAQEGRSNHSGLFGTAEQANKQQSMLGQSRAGEVNIGGDINNQNYGQDAPLGSGIAILLLAGAGYVALKKKED